MEATDWLQFMACQDMIWDELPMAWDEGPFLGNGLLGTLVFGQEDRKSLRIEVCRTDVTDHRHDDMPVSFAHGRLPIGYFELKFKGEITGCRLRMNLYDAQLEGGLNTTCGHVRLEHVVYRDAHVMSLAVSCEGDEAVEVDFVPLEAMNPRQKWGMTHQEPKRMHAAYGPNPQPYREQQGDVSLHIQPLADQGQTTVAWFRQGDTWCFTCTHDPCSDTSAMQAVSLLNAARQKGQDALRSVHRQWWHAYYQRSFLSISDAQYENFYWIQLYKQASAIREDGVVLDNQGPWLWETAWPYTTWNLNVQLSYWLCCGSNHVDLGLSLIDTLLKHQEHLAAGLPPQYREDCLAIDTVGSADCRYRITQESIDAGRADIGDLTWALHDCWRMYRFSMDERLLRKIYPLLRRSVAFMEHFLREEDGLWHFAPTASPEYGWGCPADCNYTLSIFRFGVEALLEGSRLLACDEDCRPRWEDYLNRLVPWPEDPEQGMLIGRDLPYDHSHRHYSHLLMIYPFYQLNQDMPGGKERIMKALLHWQSKPEQLRGYSCTGGASIAAAVGEGDLALQYLSGLWEHFLRPNTLYKESGPVIETPLSGAQSILDMLVQSWGGAIRLFPARPSRWKDVCFSQLLCEGGYTASACLRDGEVIYAAVKAACDGECRVMIGQKEYRKHLRAGEKWTILGEEVCEAMPQESGAQNCYGLNQRQKRIFGTPLEHYELH